jgi:beta-galactosidase
MNHYRWGAIAAPLMAWMLGSAGAGFSPQAKAEMYAAPSSCRTDVLLDSGWRFLQEDASGAQEPGFNDSSWSAVSLPHSWDIPHGQDGPATPYYRGVGWYRRHCHIDGALANREFFLKFDGAFLVSEVYLNGKLLGRHEGGFAAFVFDATPVLKVGGDNVIAVKVSNALNKNIPPLDADFTFWGGIYRDVHLLCTGGLHISPLDYGSPGVYLKTTGVSAQSAHLEVTTVLSNATANAQAVTIRAVVTDAATNVVAVLTNEVAMPPACASNVVARTVIARPHLWNGLADPYLYGTHVEVWSGGRVVDVVAQPLGFRWFNVDPTNGFFLNGQHYDLHGLSMHQDWPNCGWALTNAQRTANFAFLKEIGATFLRLSHYEHDDFTYQLADRAGLCVWSEVPVIDYITVSDPFFTNTLQQLREMIRQRCNHPSVVCWSVYNEVTLHRGAPPAPLVRQETQLAAAEDPTRFPTAAANASDSDPSTLCTPIVAFNKYYGWYSAPLDGIAAWADNIHANYPDRCVGVGEYGAGASPWQHAEKPAPPTNTAGPFHPEEWQNVVHETNWKLMAARPFLWCKLAWTSFDFASDARHEGDSPGFNDKGLVTCDRKTRKDAFYFYKANWTTEPMVYITGHTFTNRLTDVVTAKVYANCDSVELFVNGASQGRVAGAGPVFTWPITLCGGSNHVEAVGHKGGCTVSDSLVWMAPMTGGAAGTSASAPTGGADALGRRLSAQP